MINALPLFHRIAGQPVIVLGHGDAADAKRRLVERAGGLVVHELQDGIDKGARLAFVAHENSAMAEGDCIRLRCAGLMVNVPDRPELCDFTVPSILDRSPVLLAIGTSGASAGLAKALRLRLETLLPGSLGGLASALANARDRMRARWPEAGDRRQALDRALEEGGKLDLLKDTAETQVDEWLAAIAAPTSENVTEIHLTSLDPDGLTLRQARLLGSADILAYEEEVPEVLLNRARADAHREVLAKGAAPVDPQGLTVVLRLSGILP